jgi:CheY-like chemotaxis protein
MFTPFPADCCALVVEDDQVQAHELACMLTGFGCRVIGPAASVPEALQLLAGRRPSFALFDVDLPAGSLVPLAQTLIRLEVPFAVLAPSLEHPGRDRLPVLRDAPHLSKPWQRWNLHREASALHRTDLHRKILATDRRIGAGRMRLAQQIRLIERLEAVGTRTDLAASLVREMGRALRIMRASRTILCQQLETYQD